jgi:glycosyltransferase involved in cell wall biosynthesis
VPSLARGGAERTVSRLTREWARSGHDVTVAVFNAANRVYPHGGHLLDLGAPARRGSFAARLLSASGNFVLRLLRLRKILRDNQFDLVFGFMESANIPLTLAALVAGKRASLTLSVRGNPDRMPWIHKCAAFCLYGLASRVVSVSMGAANRLVEIVPDIGGRIVTIYSPVGPEAFATSVSDPRENADENAGRYFFAAGRLVPGKGFDRMIRIFAAARFSGFGPGVALRVAGEGPERARLEGLIRALGLEGRVSLLGALEDPFAEMRRATAFLMASEHEGFPVVLIEAMACGCPVVAVDCDFGPREAIRDGIEGFLVRPGDAAAFARRLELLAADPDRREAMACAARLRAADFDPERAAAHWLLPIERLLPVERFAP